MKKSQSQLDLEQVWRTALGTEGGLRIDCGAKSNAVRFRQALYNAVKWVKAPKPHEIVDEGLQEAVGECVLSLVGEGQTVVHVRRKQDDPVMVQVRQLIGGPAADTVKHAASESQARLLEMLGKDQPVGEGEREDPLVKYFGVGRKGNAER